MRRLFSLTLLLLMLMPVWANAQLSREPVDPRTQIYWLPGIDLLIHIDQQDRPGRVILGYDRESGQGSILDIEAGCYIRFNWSPTYAGDHVRAIVQTSFDNFYLVHESGLVRREHRPQSLYCIPLGVGYRGPFLPQ